MNKIAAILRRMTVQMIWRIRKFAPVKAAYDISSDTSELMKANLKSYSNSFLALKGSVLIRC